VRTIGYKVKQPFLVAVNNMDLYCSVKKVTLTRYQLLGAACLVIALKRFDPSFYNIGVILKMADGAFNEEDLRVSS
jgi:hypothetical protein